MRVLRRITLIAVLLIISAFMLTACTSTFAFDPYNSKMSDNAQKLMNEDYLNEHETSFPFRDDGLPDDICVEIQSDEEFAFRKRVRNIVLFYRCKCRFRLCNYACGSER